MAEGRLSGDELEQRLEALYAARTYGELDALLADLPVNRFPGPPRVRVRRLVGAVSAVTLVVAVLGALAIVRARAAVAVLGKGHPPQLTVLGTEHPRHLNLPGPLAAAHQGLMIAASLGAVIVVLTSAAVLWALMDWRSPRRP